MSKHKYKVGDIVEVFDDPVTKLSSQGKAKIAFVVPDTDDYYQVVFPVVFPASDDPGEKYCRFIY